MKQLVLCLALLGACTTAESTGIPTVSCPTDSTLTFTSFGATFLENNCLSCHLTRESPKLGTQAQIQAHASDILEKAVYTTAMPEDTDMTIAEREQLGEWIACGAP
jgi:uncharacterized membrane protein